MAPPASSSALRVPPARRGRSRSSRGRIEKERVGGAGRRAGRGGVGGRAQRAKEAEQREQAGESRHCSRSLAERLAGSSGKHPSLTLFSPLSLLYRYYSSFDSLTPPTCISLSLSLLYSHLPHSFHSPTPRCTSLTLFSPLSSSHVSSTPPYLTLSLPLSIF
eukprot:scaffold319629_cov36-Tisochrysis_lutea.AAC.5